MPTDTANQQVLPLRGDLCIAELPAVRARIDTMIAGGARDLVLDLSQATLVTAAALRVFDVTEQRLSRIGGRLALRNPAPLPLRVLQLTGFDRLVEIAA